MENAKEILNWYILSGITDICSDEPFRVSLAEKSTISEPKNDTVSAIKAVDENGLTKRPAMTLLAQEGQAACLNAVELCQKAQTLDDLKALMEDFSGCSLKFSANSTVFGYGNPQAELMIIGEAPGADEDRMGEPFVGRSGKLLSKMLAAIGIEREDCYITNVLPWRPPGNRTPTDGEVAVCLPFLKRQIELVGPKIILLLGGSAANTLLNCSDSVSSLRGKFVDYTTENGTIIPTLTSYHPAFLLRSAAQKAKAWSDFLRLQRKLEDI
ncbi:MAG: uracil-DNA glycosylase [Alphaproteobacteria bacterium]|nr:uracil-DNA glycosylase [Alphaproteobacteria bacterium]